MIGQRWAWGAVLGGMLCAMPGWLSAQSIYTCVDAKGRRLTYDRPIPECLDREQRELNSNGTVKRSIGPVLTYREAEAEEERLRQEAEERERINEIRRRDRALLARYKNAAAHKAERMEALRHVDEVTDIAKKRIQELTEQKTQLDSEWAFYKHDPATAPALLRKKTEDNAVDMAAQRRYIATQELEKKRINTQFDEELARLYQLWALRDSINSTVAP